MDSWLRAENINMGGWVQDYAIHCNNSKEHPLLGFVGGRIVGTLGKLIARIADVSAHILFCPVKAVVGTCITAPKEVYDWFKGTRGDYNWTLTQSVHHLGYAILFTGDGLFSLPGNFISPDLYLSLEGAANLVAKLTAQVTVLKSQIQQLILKATSDKAELASNKSKLAELDKKHKQQLDQLRSSLNSKIFSLESSLSTKNGELAKKSEELGKKSDQIHLLQQELQSLKIKENQTSKTNEKLSKDLHQVQTELLKTKEQLEISAKALDGASLKINELNTRIESNLNEIEVLNDDINQFKNEINQERLNQAQLLLEKQTIFQELSVLKIDLEHAKLKAASDQVIIQGKSHSIAELMNQKEQLQKDFQTWQAQAQEVISQTKEQQEKLVNDLNQRISLLEVKLDEKNQELNQKSTLISQLENELKSTSDQAANREQLLNSEIDSLKLEIKIRLDEVQELKTQIIQFQNTIKDHETKYDQLNWSKFEVDGKLQLLQKEFEKVNVRINQYEDKISKQNLEITSLTKLLNQSVERLQTFHTVKSKQLSQKLDGTNIKKEDKEKISVEKIVSFDTANDTKNETPDPEEGDTPANNGHTTNPNSTIQKNTNTNQIDTKTENVEKTSISFLEEFNSIAQMISNKTFLTGSNRQLKPNNNNNNNKNNLVNPKIKAQEDVKKLYRESGIDFEEYITDSMEYSDSDVNWNLAILEAQIEYDGVPDKENAVGAHRMYLWDKKEQPDLKQLQISSYRHQLIGNLKKAVESVVDRNPKATLKTEKGKVPCAQSTVDRIRKRPEREEIEWGLKLLQIARTFKYLQDIAEDVGATASQIAKKRAQEAIAFKLEKFEADSQARNNFELKISQISDIAKIIYSEISLENAEQFVIDKNRPTTLSDLENKIVQLINLIKQHQCIENQEIKNCNGIDLLALLKAAYSELRVNDYHTLGVDYHTLKQGYAALEHNQQNLISECEKLDQLYEKSDITQRSRLDSTLASKLEIILKDAEDYILFFNQSLNVTVSKNSFKKLGGLAVVAEIEARRKPKNISYVNDNGHQKIETSDSITIEEFSSTEDDDNKPNVDGNLMKVLGGNFVNVLKGEEQIKEKDAIQGKTDFKETRNSFESLFDKIKKS